MKKKNNPKAKAKPKKSGKKPEVKKDSPTPQKKKSGFLGGLFGKKKKEKVEEKKPGKIDPGKEEKLKAAKQEIYGKQGEKPEKERAGKPPEEEDAPAPPRDEKEKNPVEEKAKKRGLFGKIFGGKKKEAEKKPEEKKGEPAKEKKAPVKAPPEPGEKETKEVEIAGEEEQEKPVVEEAKRPEKEAGEPYTINDGVVEAKVRITQREGEGVKIYNLDAPELKGGTRVFVEDIKPELLKKIKISSSEAVDVKMAKQLKSRFMEVSKEMMKNNMPHLSPESQNFIAGTIAREMLGLGDIEFLLKDDFIEEICINSSKEPLWIYHKEYGWMKSNIIIPKEIQIWNYSSAIARGVGRQINTHTPLLDAYLPSGDRVNATLMPISSSGNTITIRKFARKPWTITDYIKMETVPIDVAAILWLAMQYEANIIISGGTGTGKTSLLNVLSVFIPQNQRVVSIEQTKEITLPSYLQWVPMIVREPTSEGTGSVSMLDLMVNSLRMRPDRIVVGEIRRAEEAQVLFEAMHTGHSVYATLHAETVSETLRRLTNPPINIPPVMVESLHLIVTSYRDRRSGTRKIFEVGEIVNDGNGARTNNIYEWKPNRKNPVHIEKSARLFKTIKTYTNMELSEIKKNLKEKEEILAWMVEKNINEVDKVGEIISQHYTDPESLMKMVRKK